LQAGIGQFARQLADLELGHRRQPRHILAGDILLDRRPAERPQRLHLGAQFRQAVMHHLIVEDRLAEDACRSRV
jgi:hypothetical protein